MTDTDREQLSTNTPNVPDLPGFTLVLSEEDLIEVRGLLRVVNDAPDGLSMAAKIALSRLMARFDYHNLKESPLGHAEATINDAIQTVRFEMASQRG